MSLITQTACITSSTLVHLKKWKISYRKEGLVTLFLQFKYINVDVLFLMFLSGHFISIFFIYFYLSEKNGLSHWNTSICTSRVEFFFGAVLYSSRCTYYATRISMAWKNLSADDVSLTLAITYLKLLWWIRWYTG